MSEDCKHCGAPLRTFSQSSGEFCCDGCRAAWEMIHSLGLSNFYERKAGVVTSKVDQNIHILEEMFESSVTVKETGAHSLVFYLTSVRCAACVWLVENILKKIPGVEYARVNYATYRTVVEYLPAKTNLKEILSSVAKAGYPPVADNPIRDDSEKKDIFLRFVVGAFFDMQLMGFTIAIYAGYFSDMPPHIKLLMELLSWVMATPVLLYTGYPFLKNSLRALKTGYASMDTLVALGSVSAYLYSVAAIFLRREVYFDTSATILTLITLGRFLEISAKHKAKAGILSLFSIMPMFARLLGEGGLFALVPVQRVKTGDLLQVAVGDRVPVDGVIEKGNAAVDESMLTGEPIATPKSPGDNVFAGTINTDGFFEMRANSVGKDTVLSKIIAAIESADISKTRMISIADKVSAFFIPLVLLISAITLATHLTLGAGGVGAVMNAVAVLVVACPCALGLAAPLAVNAGVGRAVNLGALVKTGDVFETLSLMKAVCFDKTGTLTKGEPVVEGYSVVYADEALFLKLASIAENYSKHPLAKALVRTYGVSSHKLLSFNEKQGQGVAAEIEMEGQFYKIAAGRRNYASLFADGVENEKEEELGKTVVHIAINNAYAGCFMFSDPLREEAKSSIAALSKDYEILLLSGDNRSVLREVSRELSSGSKKDIPYRAGLTPFEKAEIVEGIRREKVVVMVGDGINDAPAFKSASAGVAVGQRASDIAIDTADIALIRPDIAIFERVIKLSKKTVRVVRENLIWAFSYNIVALPLAAAGILHPVVSAIMMSASSLLVVLNSLRVNRC